MNIIKKIVSYLVIILFLFSFINISNVNAKTLSDLEADLNKKEKEAKENSEEIELTEEQISQTKKAINQTYLDIDNIQKEMIAKNKEIEDLNKKIKEKDEEIKELMRFLQLSSGDSVYLEYIMGAESLTDFIYRISITEQLSKYNDDLITEMNQMIKENEQKKEELAAKKKSLKSKQVSLAGNLNVLGSKKTDLEDFSRSIEEEIDTAKEVINIYRKAGCGENEDINVCANRILPPDTSFWRPLVQGYITSEYGYRYDPLGSGSYKLHSGTDMSNSDKYNTKVYAIANGKVAKVIYNGPGGGNQVIIHHNIINGSSKQKFTSVYAHLASIKVKNGQTVTKNTVVGIMGNTGGSTGVHLHLGLAYGHWYKDYYFYSDYLSHTINSRVEINYPSGGWTYWHNRTTKYS